MNLGMFDLKRSSLTSRKVELTGLYAESAVKKKKAHSRLACLLREVLLNYVFC